MGEEMSDELWQKTLRKFQEPSENVLVQYVIYDHPHDYPEHFVVRRWHVVGTQITGNQGFCYKTLEAARSVIPSWATCINRMENDDPKIVEVWT